MADNDWLCLPEHNWINILINLDFKSCLNATETCRKLSDIFAGSRKLSERVRIILNSSSDLSYQLAILQKSKRRYQKLRIIRGDTNIPMESIYSTKISEIFSENLSELELNQSTKICDLSNMLESFNQLKYCSFKGISIQEAKHFEGLSDCDKRKLLTETSNQHKNLETLHLDNGLAIFLYIFQNASNLRNFSARNFIADSEELEPFLMRQSNLKNLQLTLCNSIFKTNMLDSPSFQLESLELMRVGWNNRENLKNFMLGHRSLKSVSLRFNDYCEDDWLNLIFKELLPHNRELRRLFISTREIRQMDAYLTEKTLVSDELFISEVEACRGIYSPNVTELKYQKGDMETTNGFIKTFAKIFPNLKTLILDYPLNEEELSIISAWPHLESLSLYAPSAKLKELLLTSNSLTTFDYHPPSISNLFSEDLGSFLSRNPKIRHLTLDASIIGSYGFPKDIGRVIVDNLPNIETFTERNIGIYPEDIITICSEVKNLHTLTLEYKNQYRKEIQDICEILSSKIELKFENCEHYKNYLSQ